MNSQTPLINKEKIRLREKSLKSGFKLLSVKKGSVIDCSELCGLVLVCVNKGRIRLLVGTQKEEIFSAREMFLMRTGICMLEVIYNAEIVFLVLDEGWNALYNELKAQYHIIPKNRFLFHLPSLEIKPGVSLFIENLSDETVFRHITRDLQDELRSLLKKCYSKRVLLHFLALLDDGVSDFYDFINRNYSKYKGVEELISLSGLTQSTFNRKFREYFGYSPYQWILARRADQIKRRLTDGGDAIVFIMRDFGFTDASHFNRFCRSMFGKTPTQMRNKEV
ncbi:MAG: AraC family transcriptional regulator [Bacteroidales bacterium]|nr:AraC family transcriptional regulator [Bacteroidales bacterium]